MIRVIINAKFDNVQPQEPQPQEPQQPQEPEGPEQNIV
jgi:hypothetical protein